MTIERRIRGLAWDNDAEYMLELKQSLANHRIDLEIKGLRLEFEQAFTTIEPHFVVVDLFDDSDNMVGLELAAWVAEQRRPWYPVFVVTARPNQVPPEGFKRLPLRATFSYKTQPPWMALRINEELVRQAVLVDFKKVFVIYAHEKNREYTEPLASRLRLRGLEPEKLRPGNLGQEIAGGLLKSINNCAAVIAVCTPDIQGSEGVRMPRQNVLVEVGMTLGLPRGLERLIILRHQDATMPTDLESIGRIDFKDSIEETFDELDSALIERGVAIS
jgi:hypothetical protein